MIGQRTDSNAPDVIEPIVGLRTWRMRGNTLLSPLTDYPWMTTTEHATCHRDMIPGGHHRSFHTAPHTHCSCGLYAFSRRDILERELPLPITGIVQAWGACEIHADGVRAQYMRICALSLTPLAVQWRFPTYLYSVSLATSGIKNILRTPRPPSRPLLAHARAAMLASSRGRLATVALGSSAAYVLHRHYRAQAAIDEIARRYQVPVVPYEALDERMVEYGQPLPLSLGV